MQTSKSSLQSRNNDDLARQCWLYLCGEMEADRVAAFEARLTDVEVADELVRQSELLCELSQTAFTTSDVIPRRFDRRGAVASLLGVAAAILILFSIRHQLDAPEEDEALRIAKTWAGQDFRLSGTGSGLVDSSVLDDLAMDDRVMIEFGGDRRTESAEQVETDGQWSWMFAAMAMESTDG